MEYQVAFDAHSAYRPEVSAEDSQRAFGDVVRFQREARRWTQADLGRAAGLDRAHVGKIERGELDPGLATQRKLAAALELSLPELHQLAEDELERRLRRLGQADEDDPQPGP